MKEIEKRFKEIAGYYCNLNKFPLHEEDCPTTKNDKDKSNLHGEVFTPLWFVDGMILKSSDNLKTAKNTLDLCSGYGQFTIRMLRFLTIHIENFDAETWLEKTHSFSEYQFSSTCKLLYIFGININLFIGDAEQLYRLKDTDKGIFFYSERKKKWKNITKIIKKKFTNTNIYSEKLEETFIKELNKIKENMEGTSQTVNWMDMKRIK